MSLEVALGVFHCGARNFDAIGGPADIDWPLAAIASDENDPSRTLAAKFVVVHNMALSHTGMAGCNPQAWRAHEAARFRSAPRWCGSVAAGGPCAAGRLCAANRRADVVQRK